MIFPPIIDPSGLLALIQQHLAWYPKMEVRDVYKLVYQAIMGPEHTVATRQEFTRRLEAEFQALAPEGGRMIESIRPDQVLFRLNLRPYKLHHKQTHPLITSLLETFKLFKGVKTDLVATWTSFIALCEQGELTAFPVTEVLPFSRWLEQEGYPVVHHSEIYRQAYQPAYRLIMSQFISEIDTDASS